MRVYIAYKFQYHHNKEELKLRLQQLSEHVDSWGFSNFVLIRDVKKWKHIHLGSIRLIPVIYKNMKDCDVLVAYVNSLAFSKGLFFEIFISKLLGIKSVMYLVGDTRSRLLKYFFNHVYKIKDISEIKKEHLSF